MKKHFLLLFLIILMAMTLASCAICLNPDGQCKWENQRDWNKEFESDRKKANEGDALKQRHFAIRLLTKTNIKSDDYINETYNLTKGIEFLEKSSKQGDALAQYLLGKALVTGVASRSPNGFWPEAKDEKIPGDEIKRDFDRGIDLMAKTSQTRCYAYGNKTHEVNFEIAKFYNYYQYGKIDSLKYDAWRLRYFLYCWDEKTRPAAMTYSDDERGRFAGVMATVDYFRNGVKGPLKMTDVNTTLANIDKEKLIFLTRKYEQQGWSAKQISDYSEKLIREIDRLNLIYPLSANFVINPVWD